MPVFQPRSYVQILRDMVARTIARSRLAGLTRNSVIFHVLAAAATEDAELYSQLVHLRSVFSIDDATGSDLDERAAEVQPSYVTRRSALAASGNVIFSRPGTTGLINIPSGTLVAARDSQGQILFRTTAASSIPNLASQSAPTNVVCVDGGVRGNVAATKINQMVSRIAGVTTVSNPAAFSNGRDRESDDSFRARLKQYIQSLSRGTVRAVEGFAAQVILTNGRRVLYAKTVEPIVRNGTIEVFIDDGTGTTDEYNDDYIIGGADSIIAAAAGGETEFFTTQSPIRDDGGFVLYINAVPLTRDVDYYLNTATGQINLDSTVYPTGLTAADAVTAEYRYYINLVQETQHVIDGIAGSTTRPGVRAGGIQAFVRPATAVAQSIVARISVLSGFDVSVVSALVLSSLQDYINTLGIGANVIVAELYERAMRVNGMYNFRLDSLTGSSPPADQIILSTQVARIAAASITLT